VILRAGAACRRWARAALLLVLPLFLAACVDAKVDVAVTSATTARVAVSQTLGGETRALLALRPEADPARRRFDEFCHAGTCTFRQIAGGRGSTPGLVFTTVAPNLVQVSVPTAAIRREILHQLPSGNEAAAMQRTLFTRRNLTLRIAGGFVIRSNMEIAEDGAAAEQAIPLLRLIDADSTLPEEFFAVVRVP
jgi:hypothetical protein